MKNAICIYGRAQLISDATLTTGQNEFKWIFFGFIFAARRRRRLRLHHTNTPDLSPISIKKFKKNYQKKISYIYSYTSYIHTHTSIQQNKWKHINRAWYKSTKHDDRYLDIVSLLLLRHSGPDRVRATPNAPHPPFLFNFCFVLPYVLCYQFKLVD